MNSPLAHLLPHLRRLTAPADPDADLLERFARQRDEAAFADLVARHGPMVFNACRRILGDDHTAQDAFQAVFLVLARRAGSLGRPVSLAGWLYGVAQRVARNARRARLHARTPASLADVPEPLDRRPDPLAELTVRELLTVLEDEVRRLPEAYRLAVVLCCLEGLSLEEAARRLHWTTGSLRGNLERGRKRLHQRLTRRGLTLGAALATAEVARGKAQAGFFAQTVQAALQFSASATTAPVTATASHLAEQVLRASGLAWLRRGFAVALLLGVTVLVAATLSSLPLGEEIPHAAVLPPPQEERPRQVQPFEEPLPAGAVARLGALRFWTGSTVQSVAFSPDGQTLASGHQDHTIHLWEVASGKEIGVLQGHRDQVLALAFSPDGKLLASRGGDCNFQDNRICLWDVASGKELRRFGASASDFVPSFEGSASWAFRLAFSPDSKLLVSGAGSVTDRRHALHLWDVATGQELRTCRGHTGLVRCFAFAPDGTRLASGSEDGTVRLWDPASGKELHQLTGHQGKVLALDFSPDGQTLASAGEDHDLRLWAAGTGKERSTLEVAGPVYSVAFLDNQTLAWGDKQGAIHLVDLPTGRERRRLERHRFWVSDLCPARNGKLLASIGSGLDFAVHLWDTDTGKPLSPPPFAHGAQVSGVTFTLDGRSLITSCWDGTLRFWGPTTGKELRRLEIAFCPAPSPDGQLLAVLADGGGTLRLLDLTGKELRRLQHPGSGSFMAIAFSPDSKTLVIGENRIFGTNFEGVVSLWDVATGQELRVLRGHRNRVETVAFSPDGKWIASGSERETAARLWETATGKELRQLAGHQIYVGTVAFAPDGAWLVTAGREALHFWDPATGKELRQLAAQTEGLALSPDGRLLAASVYEKGYVVRLWEVASLKEICSWHGHRGRIPSIAFAPDSRTLASASHDATALVWDVTGLLQQGRLPSATLARAEVELLWKDLASPDAARAQQAVWKLVSAPDQALPWLRESLRPAPGSARLAGLIADLESEQFAKRNEATADLERLGDTAEPALRAALQGKRSLELSRRVEALLQRLQQGEQAPERLRLVRAMQVLEYSGTPEARAILRGLAQGAPTARLTCDAAAALQRLSRRTPLDS